MKKSIFKFGTVIASILALVMIFFDLIVLKKSGYTGLDIIFGKKELGLSVMDFSFVGLIFLILLIVMVVTSVLKLLDNFKKQQQILNLVLVVSSVIVAILFFLMNNSIIIAGNKLSVTLITETYKLAPGAILGGMFSLAAAGFGITDIVVKK